MLVLAGPIKKYGKSIGAKKNWKCNCKVVHSSQMSLKIKDRFGKFWTTWRWGTCCLVVCFLPEGSYAKADDSYPCPKRRSCWRQCQKHVATWRLLTWSGFLKTMNWTDSWHGGAVNEPLYVQYFLVSSVHKIITRLIGYQYSIPTQLFISEFRFCLSVCLSVFRYASK